MPVQADSRKKRRFIFLTGAALLVAAIILMALAKVLTREDQLKTSGPAATVLKNGTADLSHWDTAQNSIILLDGEWEFYWKELLGPEDLAAQGLAAPAWVQVPKPWTEYTLHGESLSNEGYATYRLRLLLPEAWTRTHETLGIYPKSIASAYRIWINGSPKGGNGTVGTGIGTTTPKSYPQTIYFESVEGWNEIIIQVANFHQRNNGIWQGVELGTAEAVSRLRTSRVAAQIFVIGIFFMMSLYYFLVYFNRKKEVSALLFGGLCMFVGIRTVVLGESTALYFLPGLPWEWAVKAEYLSISMVALTLIFFVNREYPAESISWMPAAAGVVLSTFMLFFVTTSARIYTYYLSLFIWGVLFPVLMYTMYVYICSVVRRRKGSVITAVGFLFFTMFALNDMLFYSGILPTEDLLSIGLLAFLMTQALNLSARFSRAIEEREQLSEQLMMTNRSLEHTVAERTCSLQKSNASLQEANQRMADLEAFRVRLLSNISHELSTPITSIKGFAKGLRDGIITDEAPKYANRIYERSILLERMIHDLVELTKLETNQVRFQMQDLPAISYFRELFLKYEWEIQSKGVECHIVLPEESGCHLCVISGDPVRLEQVLSNLISNALRFTEAGGSITLRLSLKSMLQDGRQPRAVVGVEDTGTGIEYELHEQIFERFTQVKQPASKHQGSGLGLAICREIIHYHHGAIHVRSEPGAGAEFYFELPVNVKERGPEH